MSDSFPIKFHGGKTYLAKKIISLFPEHVHYVEPFFGGGAVLLSKPPELIANHSEVASDIYGDLVNFWTVLQSRDMFPEFVRVASLTPVGSPIFQRAKQRAVQSLDPVARAVAFFVIYRQSRQGLGKDFATLSKTRTRRGMNEQVSSWLGAIDGLAEAHERLIRVVIRNEPATTVIRLEDGPDTFFYLDPPYLAETRVSKESYVHEMTTEDHSDLLEMLSTIRGKFLLSGYRSRLYDEAAARWGWKRFDISIDAKSSAAAEKPERVECLWSNY